MRKTFPFFALFILVLVIGTGCRREAPSHTQKVRYHLTSDPESFGLFDRPTSAQRDVANFVHHHLYTSVGDTAIVPILAKGPYTVSEDRLTYTIEIHPDATWDDGKPITSEDVLFSLKLHACPHLRYTALLGYLEYLKEFTILDSKKFQLKMKSYYMFNDTYLCNFPIVDKRIYDKKGMLEKYNVMDFLNQNKTWEGDSTLVSFSKEIKDIKYGRSPEFVKGAGPYNLVEYRPNESVLLAKKKDYWGAKLDNIYLRQDVDSILMIVVKEEVGYENAFLQKKLDVSVTASTAVFKKLAANPDLQKDYFFKMTTKDILTGAFFNLRPDGVKHLPFFTDVNTRRALAYLMPIDDLLQPHVGEYERISSPIPNRSPYYNKNLSPHPFSPALADSLLSVAGWKDTDGDKILDKVINGKKQKFIISFHFNKNAKALETMLIRIQQEMQKSGIVCKLEGLDHTVLGDKVGKFDFDVIFMAQSTQLRLDYKDLFHSTSTGGKGANFSGFGTRETDALIEKTRTEPNPAQFKILNDSIQSLIHHEVPVVYFYTLRGRLIASKRFDNIEELTTSQPQLNTLAPKK